MDIGDLLAPKGVVLRSGASSKRQALHALAEAASHAVGLDEARIRAIEAVTDVPLVIHGGSGVPYAQRAALAAGSRIAKFNIGTELRMAFGAALREAVTADPMRFDRVAILKETHDPVLQAARAVIRGLGASGKA